MTRNQKQLNLQLPRIFLSYAKEDRNKVSSIYRRLLNERLNPWLDLRDLLPGQDWDNAIVSAIRNARFVLVFLSNQSVNKRGYVQKEIREALDIADKMPEGEVFIIPVRLEECSVPDRLTKWQWIDMFRPNGFGKIIKCLKLHLGEETEASHGKTQSNRIIAPPRDSIIDLLLVNKFRRRGRFMYGRMPSGQMAMSDAVFLEFRDKIPAIFMQLRKQAGNSSKLSQTIVAGIIPPIREYRKKKFLLREIRFMKSLAGVHILITEENLRCAVDSEYLHYILAKYPNGKIYVRGRNVPLIVENGRKPCCALMPMNFSMKDLR
jgi:TIR domain